jgi:hypothetical protein
MSFQQFQTLLRLQMHKRTMDDEILTSLVPRLERFGSRRGVDDRCAAPEAAITSATFDPLASDL